MPTVLQFRRGTTAQNDAFTGSSGEITVDTDLGLIRVHDGSTQGGTTMVSRESSRSDSLGVGTAASGTEGQIRASNSITAYYSDERLKTDINPIAEAVKKVMAIKGVTFRANELAESFGYDSSTEQVGVIAQDIKKVLPQIVVGAPFDTYFVEGVEMSQSGEGYMTVHYDKLVPLLIEAIKEQQGQIEELKTAVTPAE